MRWKGRQGSSNVEDRRSGGGRKRRIGGKIGIGTIIIIVIALFLGRDPMQLLQQTGNLNTNSAPAQPATTKANDEMSQFVSVVLKDTEDVFDQLFRKYFGKAYQKPVLVIFSGETQSACGFASAATGPFYCPGDQKVYIDLSFYQQLKTRFGAPGDFAMAYVIAHEVGHHVQYLMGITRQVHSQKRRISKEAYNQLSVRMELQADFLAGVWAHHAHKMKNVLEKGDLEEALRAANAIGDDRLQMRSKGYVVPESFTHGSSEQRMRWFRKGFDTGDLNQGDTFAADYL